MKHIDILIHFLTLLSGIMTALLGFLLYLKYRLKEIRYYSLFILTTTFTVASTTVYSYLSFDMNKGPYSFWQIVAFLFFEVFLLLINYAFSLFALGIINKPFTFINKIYVNLPALFILLSAITIFVCNIGKAQIIIPAILGPYFIVILFLLFLTFIVYSIRIAINLKNIVNLDLKRALKVLALLFILFIPVQTFIIVMNRQQRYIMLSRNIFYLLINITSIIFTAKYFFIQTPSIMDWIEIGDPFLKKYAITRREKEVIELLLSGLSIKEISGKLDRSFKTVNNHIYNIYQKTDVSSKLELLNLIKENKI